jgi:DNA-binding phage protein
MSEIAVIRKIKAAAQMRAKAEEAKREATEQLRIHCLEAHKCGLPITLIAAEAGLSRQGIYNLLRKRHPSADD